MTSMAWIADPPTGYASDYIELILDDLKNDTGYIKTFASNYVNHLTSTTGLSKQFLARYYCGMLVASVPPKYFGWDIETLPIYLMIFSGFEIDDILTDIQNISDRGYIAHRGGYLNVKIFNTINKIYTDGDWIDLDHDTFNDLPKRIRINIVEIVRESLKNTVKGYHVLNLYSENIEQLRNAMPTNKYALSNLWVDLV